MKIETMTMPQLGESVTEGTISKWLVNLGDTVNKYDPIAEVMTDKVSAEIPSSFSGKIQELMIPEDETVSVGAPICRIEVQDSKPIEENVSVKETARSLSADVGLSVPARYSPAVLRLSQEHQIDLSKVTGTGAGGRITRKDLLKFIESGPIEKESRAEVAPPAEEITIKKLAVMRDKTVNDIQQSRGANDEEIPVTAVRKTIAANMVRSKQEVPHAWMMIEADVTNLVVYRDQEKTAFLKKEGFNLTYFAFFVKAVAQALKEFPQLNATWNGDKIILKKDIHLSIAVAAEDSLFVPVIKNADEKSIKGIAREIAEFAEKARNNKLRAEDMQGGTFTVNNTGSFGSIQSYGIINYPQAAILQIESIVKRPVIIDNMIAVRDMVNLCLSLDHRVLDGLICGRFLARLKEIVENISKETTAIY
ncbi:2-oxo acid dehydrogenase subunit E2 [Bacillus sp. AGMB 02131]|uniref:Dihydrolipoamide acetyltransferase component of pyruvate dehydrogenase complex n=1 Tax=Peribacillus faecalis TaxID=2772559 RepID=A0A927CYJ4_9BACI|nr:dihydrolipoamide acetyltransferase family protein [Peribacillus faecalis]MBD3108075.1 2-oxo acid dehydrogenase subunit E2 [Peribacillus faecalis]